MKDQYEEVELETLNKGDVVHVSFGSPLGRRLYLNLTVNFVTEAYLFTEDEKKFYKEYSRFYLVKKAKKPLPTELGAVVEHTDGWKFVRVGEDDWIGITPGGVRSPGPWYDSEVDSSGRKDVA